MASGRWSVARNEFWVVNGQEIAQNRPPATDHRPLPITVYLIDGNNVMGQRVGWHRDKSAARKRLLVELARFVHRKKARVAVVFDGAPEINIADGSSYRSVKVYFSGVGSDADSRILEFVEAAKNRQAWTVVTSDLQLTRQVRACGVRVIRSGVFRRMLEDVLSEPDESDLQIRADELSEWMRYFGVAGVEEE